MMHDIANQIALAVRNLNLECEKAIFGQIEVIEGRVPSDDEIVKHSLVAQKETETGHARVYYWKQTPIVTAEIFFEFETGSINTLVQGKHPVNPDPDIESE
jgi:hypothetical protein